MRVPFLKYVGCGNDFILLDNRLNSIPHSPAWIKKLCLRSLGVGADGVILLESSSFADFKMRIFNADGSEAEMCGNGARCLMKFIHELGFKNPTYNIQTLQSQITLTLQGEKVQVEMPLLKNVEWDITLEVEHSDYKLDFLNTGVPHAVLIVKDLHSPHWMLVAKQIRNHSFFSPHGTNVNLARLDQEGKVEVRTYERGVEGETLACGTGATAAALVFAKRHSLLSPVTVKTASGEELEVFFTKEGETIKKIILSGPAICTFRGELHLD